MKYIAKESYKKLSDDKNFYAFGSAAKHNRLMSGLEIEVTNVPKELKSHLQSAEIKKVKKEDK